MRIVDLFCGGGLMTSGLDGCEAILAVDADPWALLCYKLNHDAGARRVQADLLREEPRSVLAAGRVTECDLLHASPPCQPWSRSFKGHWHGSELCLLRVMDYVGILRPPLVTIENVLGLSHGRGRPWLASAKKRMKGFGYRTAEWELDSWDFGVPQRRKRLYLVGTLEAEPPSPPDPTHGVAGGPSRLVLGDVLPRVPEPLADGIVPMSGRRSKVLQSVEEGETYPGAKSRRRRPCLGEPVATLPTSPSLMTQSIPHPTEGRHLSVREYAWLMGVPGYRFPGRMVASHRYRILGNGNPPQVFGSVLKALGKGVPAGTVCS